MVTVLPPMAQRDGHLLLHRVGGHDGVGRRRRSPLRREPRPPAPGMPACDGGDVQRLADDAGGGHHEVLWLAGRWPAAAAAHICSAFSWPLGAQALALPLLATTRPGTAVLQVLHGDIDGRRLDPVAWCTRPPRHTPASETIRARSFFIAALLALDARSGRRRPGSPWRRSRRRPSMILRHRSCRSFLVESCDSQVQSRGLRKAQHQIHVLHRRAGGALAQVVKEGGDSELVRRGRTRSSCRPSVPARALAARAGGRLRPRAPRGPAAGPA